MVSQTSKLLHIFLDEISDNEDDDKYSNPLGISEPPHLQKMPTGALSLSQFPMMVANAVVVVEMYRLIKKCGAISILTLGFSSSIAKKTDGSVVNCMYLAVSPHADKSNVPPNGFAKSEIFNSIFPLSLFGPGL